MAVLGQSRSGAPPDQILDLPLKKVPQTGQIAYLVLWIVRTKNKRSGLVAKLVLNPQPLG